MKEFNPELIVLARESRGLTQKELSTELGLEQYEVSRMETGGVQQIPEELMEKLSKVLQYPVHFFYQEFPVYPLLMNFYRKHKTLSAKELKSIAALINIYRERVRRLLTSVDIEFLPIPQFSIEKCGPPEKVAQMVREYLKLPRGAVSNVTELLEKLGVVVIQLDFGIRKFSGASLFIDNNMQILFLNKMPADRVRFTLAHELGHLVMHNYPDPNNPLEEEADRFAAEFLMPSADIAPYLSNLSLERLAQLKLHWRVAMSAILKKAHTLGKVSDRTYRKFWEKMGKQGYRLNEPRELEPPPEIPSLFKEMIDYHLQELKYSVEDLSYINMVSPSEYHVCYLPQKSGLRLVA